MHTPDYLSSPTCWALMLGGLIATGLLTPFVMRVAHAFGAVDRGGYRKVTTRATPLLGGLALLAPLLGLCVFGITGGTGMLASVVPLFTKQFIVLGIGAMAICALGIWDDIRGMRARIKLAGQIVVAVFVCLAGQYVQRFSVPLVGEIRAGPFWGFVLSVLWIVGMINAFNLIDGVDGLASGIALIATVALGILGAQTHNTFIVLNCAVLAGSLIAFLGFNFNPARIFLGDTGSMLLGYMLASITLMGTYKSQAAFIVAGPLLALGFPIFETLVSMLRRFLRGMPVFTGDNRHTHHRLLKAGYSQRQVVLRLYAVALVMAGAAILLGLVPNKPQWKWFPLGLYLIPLIWIAWVAGYLRPRGFEEALSRRQRNAILGAFSRYAVLCLSARSARIALDDVLHLCRREMRLRLLEVWLENGPTLLAASGTAEGEQIGQGTLVPMEKVRVQTHDGAPLVVQFLFEERPTPEERHEVSQCLATIFDRFDILRTQPQVLEIPARQDRKREITEKVRRHRATR